MTRTVLLATLLSVGSAMAQSSLRKPIDALPLPSFKMSAPAGPVFTPAPVPNRDARAPTGPRVRRPDAEFSPSLFNRSDQFRGDGYSNGSTAQSEQEKRVRPGAGFNLRMPLQEQKP